MTVATRYECLYSATSGAHARGDGKPRARKCGYCGGGLFIRVGLWGAFEWTAENRYPAEKAKETFTSMKRADRYAEANELVVRWIPGGIVSKP